MTNIVELAVAVAIGMTGAFQSGLESLQTEAYEEAVGYFTTVIEAEIPAEELYWPALYYRAQANAARAERSAALSDAGRLLVSDASPLIKNKALALYLAQEGDLEALRPKSGPKQVLENAITAFHKGDQAGAQPFIAGGLSEALAVMDVFSQAHGMHARRGFLNAILDQNAGIMLTDERFDDTNRTATVMMTMRQGSFGMRIGLVNRNGEWSATELKEVVVQHRHDPFTGRVIETEAVTPPVTMRKEDVDEALAAEVQGLIEALGDGQASVRAAARRRLAAVKDAARPFLEEHLNDPDPEIQVTIRELLK